MRPVARVAPDRLRRRSLPCAVELLAPNSADGSSVHALRATPDVAESSDGSEELVDELVEGQLVVVGWVVAVAFEETLGEGGAILKVSLVERRLRVMRARSWQGSARPMRPVSMRPTTSMLSGATEVRAQVRPIDVTEHFRRQGYAGADGRCLKEQPPQAVRRRAALVGRPGPRRRNTPGRRGHGQLLCQPGLALSPPHPCTAPGARVRPGRHPTVP